MTLRRWNPTSRRSREGLNQRRDVDLQRGDVPEGGQNQRRDVEIQRRNVPEEGQTDVATFQRRPKMYTMQPWSKIRENSLRVIVTLWTSEVL